MTEILKKIVMWYAIGILFAGIMSLIIAMTAKAADIPEVPEEILALSEELGKEYGICPELLQAIAYRESRFREDAENGDCKGLMQVDPGWHRDRMEKLGATDLFDAGQNMTVAADYLSELAGLYEDVGIALMAYNGDSGMWDVMKGTGDLSEYALETLELSAALEELHGK